MNIVPLGKILIIFGIILIGLGIFFVLINPVRNSGAVDSYIESIDRNERRVSNRVNKIPFIGRLPGDIYIQKKNFSFYFPLMTSIVLSIILSLILWLWQRK